MKPRKKVPARKVSMKPAKGRNTIQFDQARFDQGNEVRAIARERVGPVKPSQALLPKIARKKPKHKKPPWDE